MNTAPIPQQVLEQIKNIPQPPTSTSSTNNPPNGTIPEDKSKILPNQHNVVTIFVIFFILVIGIGGGYLFILRGITLHPDTGVIIPTPFPKTTQAVKPSPSLTPAVRTANEASLSAVKKSTEATGSAATTGGTEASPSATLPTEPISR